MFGDYDIPLRFAKDGLSLSVERMEEVLLLYRRESGDEKAEKILPVSTEKILLNPIEPLNKPKALTSYLLIEFETTLVVEPGATQQIYVKYPLEIGVFISSGNGNDDFKIFDIFTLMKPKFTLYGDPSTGVICKYCKSAVYSSIPSVNHIHEGVLELSITNTSTGWVEVTKAVFNACGMNMYYNDYLVAMKANMNIQKKELAETEFSDSPLETGMKKSLKLYTVKQVVKKVAITTTKFVMEEGI